MKFILFFILCIFALASGGKLKPCKLGEIFSVDGKPVGIFGESGGGAGGYFGLITSDTEYIRCRFDWIHQIQRECSHIFFYRDWSISR